MIFRPDRKLLGPLLAAVVAGLAIGGPLSAAPGDDAIAEAVAALERGDGLAAEVAGKRALQEGASRAQVAAIIGEGEFLQGDMRDARSWLGEKEFSPATRQRGLHTLARLEMAQDNFSGAAEAFNLLLQDGPGTAQIWVDVGRMRYRGGEHHAALAAAREAVRLDPNEPRALEFLAQLVRDSQGLTAALPLFQQALSVAPDDTRLMSQYASSLGDAGQNAQMLTLARLMLEKDGEATYAFYLQAVLAARAGQDDLARRIWWRTNGAFDATASGLLVSGILEYRSGNSALAVEQFDQLHRMQPFNATALLLYGRALVANGEANVAVNLLEPHAQRPDVSNYLLTLLARAHEQLGQREQAATYLDRSARLARPSLTPIPAFLPRDDYGNVRDRGNPVIRLRELLGDGRTGEARTMIAGLMENFPGSVDLQLLAGDTEMLAGKPDAALAQYQEAAIVRTDWPIVRRMVAAMMMQGEDRRARAFLAEHLSANPRNQAAAALLGRLHRDAGNPARATVFLRHAASFGSGPADPLLLADLAEMELVLGNEQDAYRAAQSAQQLQRGNRRVANTLAQVIAMSGGDAGRSQVLFAKAHGRGFADRATE